MREQRATEMMTTIIEPTKSLFKINWREIVDYRDLLVLLAKRDVTIVYKQTVLGPLWFLIQPIITAVVFTVIFGRVAKISTDGVPHFVFYMSGIVIWNYFQGILNGSGTTFVANSDMFAKVYFPRLVAPLSTVVSNLPYLLLNMLIFVVFYLYYVFRGFELHPSLWLLAMPLLIIYTAAVGLGFGLWVAALTTKYRDLRFALPFVLQIWMYATPIVYPASGVVNPLYRTIMWTNPVSIAVEFNRLMFTGQSVLNATAIGIGLCVTAFILFSGIIAFNKIQRNFVDTM